MQTTLGEVAGQTGPVQDLLRSRPEQCVLAAHRRTINFDTAKYGMCMYNIRVLQSSTVYV